jgi:flagellin
MTVINTNIKSLISQNALAKNSRSLSSAMEQLSTGKRINSAKDDAAGLAISSRMTAQIRGLDQAVRNGNDSMSMLQTAEGAMIEITSMVQRMRELSVQAANDTYSKADRGYLDLEYQQLKEEVGRVTKETQWNGFNLLDGSFSGDQGEAGKFAFQVGASKGQVITHTLGEVGFSEFDSATTKAAFSAISAGASTMAMAGTYAVGDSISLSINDNIVSYTVTAEDVAATAPNTNIATNIFEAAKEVLGTTRYTITNTPAGSVKFAAGTEALVTTTATSTTGTLSNLVALEINSTPNSNESIRQLDFALDKINQARAGLGAMINRLTYAVDNLTNVSQYTSASRSSILDADYAKASSELARTQIIQQAATAVLAQANTDQQTVLKLLQG